MNYDDLSKLVNDAYRETGDIRETVKETGLTFEEVWDMTGMRDWLVRKMFASQYFCFSGITPLTPPVGSSTSFARLGIRCMWQCPIVCPALIPLLMPML